MFLQIVLLQLVSKAQWLAVLAVKKLLGFNTCFLKHSVLNVTNFKIKKLIILICLGFFFLCSFFKSDFNKLL